MRFFSKAILGALMFAGAGLMAQAPATAASDAGLAFGADSVSGMNPCDYYDYYDQPPPWGLPEDYCDYPVYSEPVYSDGTWYRGPIYYRWTHGRRMFWLNGGWHEDAWHGPRPPGINWIHRGNPRNMPQQPRNGFRPGIGFHGGGGHDWRSVNHLRSGTGNRPGIAIRSGGAQWGGGSRIGGGKFMGGNLGGAQWGNEGFKGGGDLGGNEHIASHSGGGGFQGGGGGMQGGGFQGGSGVSMSSGVSPGGSHH